jgi:mono/diheme cytochrome c family protein
MPGWANEAGLKPEEIQKVVAYLRQLGGNTAMKPETTAPRWVKGDANVGQRLFAANCSGCHGAKGEGGEGPALNNKILLATATDTFLIETIKAGRRGTAMQGFESPSPTRAALAARELESIVSFIRTWETKK